MAAENGIQGSGTRDREDYQLLDSGHGRKLERFGPVILARPCGQAVWEPQHPDLWQSAQASFDRTDGLRWEGREELPEEWEVVFAGIRMRLATTDFGHLGVFPETVPIWQWIEKELAAADLGRAATFLNLFAYSGGATLAAARAGAACCHLDASRGMVDWANDNARRNGLDQAPIRWIVDDVTKFLRREVRRGRRYDAILLDPPSFGRGSGGELFKVEKDILLTLDLVRQVLSDSPLFVVLTSHTPGLTPIILQNLLIQFFGVRRQDCGEMVLDGRGQTFDLPSGAWARWLAD